MDGEHPSEVSDKAREILMGEVLHHDIPIPRVEDGVSVDSVPKEGIKEGGIC